MELGAQVPNSVQRIQYDCFKSYEESTTYLKGQHAVRFASLYHYASLVYKAGGKLPAASLDGNFYDLGHPIESICGDILSRTTDVLIGDYRLKARVEAVIEKADSLMVEQFLLENGFIPVDMVTLHGEGVMVTPK